MRDLVLDGGVAVITGAAGGIGAALAARLAAAGSDLALLDRDSAALAARVDELRSAHPAVEISGHVVDLADAAAIPAAAEAVLARHPRITLLINNAGIALGGTFDQVSAEDVDAVLAVNLHAVIAITRAFLPALRASPGSHLVTVSSVFGLLAPAGQVAYTTSKFAVRGFSEALRAELRPLGVGVTVVHPGGVATRIATDARVGAGLPDQEWREGLAAMQGLLRMPPDAAARIILVAVRRRRGRVVVGRDARALDLLVRLLPVRSAAVLAAGTTAGRWWAGRRGRGGTASMTR